MDGIYDEVEELLPTAELSEVFPNGVVRGHLHIVVKTPGTSDIRLLLVLISYAY